MSAGPCPHCRVPQTYVWRERSSRAAAQQQRQQTSTSRRNRGSSSNNSTHQSLTQSGSPAPCQQSDSSICAAACLFAMQASAAVTKPSSPRKLGAAYSSTPEPPSCTAESTVSLSFCRSREACISAKHLLLQPRGQPPYLPH